ncbi:NhaP [Scardovia inopinata]|uniref:Na+/H+ antiporter n=1 Tax=Scardovia inopinata F0304 TaxID=641146 RepID=W5IJC3_SCAIO|nr:cation:proton antiporter [Scardovia inopinata]EFG27100.1 Na+/H+ antiporter [Scardovia inopinata F0304]BAR06712.1 putative Na+/H+ antiporter [Scardovia inopinata JCM 12537]SUV52328.1 NhaP [Scardovia inopinata]
MQLITVIVIIMAAVLLSSLVSPYIPRVSLPLVQIALGLVCYYLPFIPTISVDDSIYMIVFIAPLLFFDAKESSLLTIRKTLAVSLSLAVGLVLLSVVATGFTLHLLWPAIGIPAAMALGAALGPTDAVAVSEIRKEADLNDNQVSILSTESLFNDAASIVSFQFALATATTGKFSPTSFTGSVLYSFLGGAVLGLLLGLFFSGLMLFLRRKSLETTTSRITMELLFPLLSYTLAEHIHVSGVIAVVAAGLILTKDRKDLGSDVARTNLVSSSVWTFVTFSLNGSVFVLLGMELPEALKHSISSPLINTWLLLVTVLVLTLILLFFRFLWIMGAMTFSPVDKQEGGNQEGQRNTRGRKRGIRAWKKSEIKSALTMTVGGVKGTISLILAFSLPSSLGTVNNFPVHYALLFIAGSFIIISLVLANIALPLLAPKNDAKQEEKLTQATLRVLKRTMSKLSSLQPVDAGTESAQALSAVLHSYSLRIARENKNQNSSSDMWEDQVKDLHIQMLEKRRQWLLDYQASHPDCEYAVSHLMAPIESGLSASTRKLTDKLGMRLNYLRLRIHILILLRSPHARSGIPSTASPDSVEDPSTGKSIVELQEELTDYTITSLLDMMHHLDSHSYPPDVLALVLSDYQALRSTLTFAGKSRSSRNRQEWERALSHMQAQAYQIELETITEMQDRDEITLSQARRMRSNVYIMQSDDALDD